MTGAGVETTPCCSDAPHDPAAKCLPGPGREAMGDDDALAAEFFASPAGRPASKDAGRETPPCTHPLPDLGRFEADVCHACGEDVSEGASPCAMCDMRLAVVAVRPLADVALHVTRTRPFGDDARCIECCMDDITRLVVKP